MPRKRKQRGKHSGKRRSGTLARRARRVTKQHARKLRKSKVPWQFRVRKSRVKPTRKYRRKPKRGALLRVAERAGSEVWREIRKQEKVTFGKRLLQDRHYWLPVFGEGEKLLGWVPWMKGVKPAVTDALKLERGQDVKKLRRRYKLDVIPGFKLFAYDAEYGEAIWHRLLWTGEVPVGHSAEDKYLGEAFEEIRVQDWRDKAFAWAPEHMRRERESAYGIRVQWVSEGESGWEQSSMVPYYEARNLQAWIDFLEQVCSRLGKKRGYGQVMIVAAELLISAHM